MKDNWGLEVKEFFRSDEDEKIVAFNLPKKYCDKLSDYKNIITELIKCRLIKVILEDGEIEILCTSLLDPIKYKTAGFGAPYHLSWNHEESYKILKC